MDIVWISTVVGNVFLALWLLEKGHRDRYRFLFASCVLSVFADFILYFCKTYDHPHYTLLRDYMHWLWIAFNFLVCLEGVLYRNWCEHLPVEVYAAAKLVALTTKRLGFLWPAYRMQNDLRWLNLAIIVWYVWCYRKESPYEQRRFW